MPIQILRAPVSLGDLRRLAEGQFGEFVSINLFPDLPTPGFIEFDSMINVRPSQGNRLRGVEDPDVRRQIEIVVERLVAR